MNDILFSSASVEWETPQDVFDELNAEFHFSLDAAATEENAKCERYYTKAEDGLKMPWGGSFGATLPTGGKSVCGCRKPTKAHTKTPKLLSCLFQRGQTHDGSTTMFCIGQKSGLSPVD